MPHQTSINGSQNNLNKTMPHFILVPLLAQGHMIPMLDLARLLAASGATVTFITTPVNSARIRPSIDRIQRSALPIHFVDLQFPSADAGLPAGCENVDLIPSHNLFKPFMTALRLLAPQLHLHLTTQTPAPPDCLIFDSMNGWAATVADSLDIPRFIFIGPSCFFILCRLLVKKNRVLETITDKDDLFTIPGLPEPVKVMKSQVSSWMDKPEWEDIREELYAAWKSANGVVINTFEALEFKCLEKYREVTGKKVWSIGPVSLSNRDVDSQAIRGKVSSVDTQLLVNWMDSKPHSSILYISFGSLARNPFSQLVEIGRGLESALSSLPTMSFVWVVKEEEKSEEGEKWLLEFEERTKGRGMVIRGWAPQAVILSHVAVGGFMTHCGWNSTLEAVAAGVVMVTWPRFGDQFLNEKLVVDVLKVGVAVGAKATTLFVDEMSEEAQVKGDDLGMAIVKVMDGGKEGEERRERATQFGEEASKALKEGGSSFENLKDMIQFAKRDNKHL